MLSQGVGVPERGRGDGDRAGLGGENRDAVAVANQRFHGDAHTAQSRQHAGLSGGTEGKSDRGDLPVGRRGPPRLRFRALSKCGRDLGQLPLCRRAPSQTALPQARGRGESPSPRPWAPGRLAAGPLPGLQTPAGPPAPWGNALRGHRPQERRRKMANLPADRTGPSRRGHTLVIARRSRAQRSGPGGLAHAAAHAWLAGWSSARGRGSAPSSRLSEPSGALRLARPRPREAPPGPGSRSAPEPGRALPAAPWL